MDRVVRVLGLSWLVALVLAGTPSPVYAARFVDLRPCVTSHELWTTPAGLSRAHLERRWEVAGEGRRIDDPVLGAGWAYPMCDYSARERVAVAQFDPGYGLSGVGEIDRAGTRVTLPK